MAAWQAQPRLTPGGQPFYSDAAIEMSLMLRSAFRMPLRQAQGLMGSVFQLLGVALPVPDYSTVSRRAMKLPPISVGRLPEGPLHLLIDSTGLKVYGAGEWLTEKHGARARRCWSKLHLAVDANTNMIMASVLTGKEVDDPSQVQALLDQIPDDIAQITADGAYDGEPTYQAIAAHGADIAVVIPPRSTAVPSKNADTFPTQRDRHIAAIAQTGRLGWQNDTGYGQRSLVETAMGRYKAIIGPKLRARILPAQQGETAIATEVLNRMIRVAKPLSIRAT